MNWPATAVSSTITASRPAKLKTRKNTTCSTACDISVHGTHGSVADLSSPASELRSRDSGRGNPVDDRADHAVACEFDDGNPELLAVAIAAVARLKVGQADRSRHDSL